MLPWVSARGFTLKVSVTLWALAASTLLFAKALPYQDLPNHLASLSILENAGAYPEFVGTGLLKTNSAIFALVRMLRFFGADWTVASKLVACVILALSAVSFCRLLARLGATGALAASAPFLLPLVHGWFLEMGMLDYALAVPLVCEAILATEDLLRSGRTQAMVLAGLFCALAYYAHVFTLCIFVMLSLLELLGRRSDPGFWRACFTTGTAGLACALTLLLHLLEGRSGAAFEYRAFLPPWENAYNAWAECAAGYTKLELSSLLILVPMVLVVWQRKFDAPWFGRSALLALGLFTFFGPYIVTAWFYVANRFAPFFWLGILVNLRVTWPRWCNAVWLTSTLLFWAGLCFDTRRMSAEHEVLRAASAHVPDHARLLPLMMRPKGSSEHTRQLLQAWGYFVLERHTSAPLLFAHSKLFPVMTRTPPPERLNHLTLERIAMHGGSPAAACAEWGPLDGSCEKRFETLWRTFWRDTAPAFEYVLMQGPPSEQVLALARGEIVFRNSALVLLRVQVEGASHPQ